MAALASVLAEPVQSQAAFVFGFDEDHASILKSDAMQELFDQRFRVELERRQVNEKRPSALRADGRSWKPGAQRSVSA